MMLHPEGVGLWRITHAVSTDTEICVEKPGHTAHEAYLTAGPTLGWPGFSEVRCELVADSVEPEAAPSPQPPSPATVRKVRHRLRQQGVSA